MSTHHQPRRAPRAVLAVAAVAAMVLVAASCSSGSAWVVRVDGHTVDTPNFAAGVPVFAKYNALVSQASPPTTVVEGVSSNSDAANYALFLVQIHGVEELNARHGTKVSSAQKAQLRKSFESSPQAKGFPGWFLDQIVDVQANFQALVSYYAKGVDGSAEIQKYYDSHKSSFRQVCMDVIGSTSESQLTAAKSRIEEGSDIATVAKAVAAEQPKTSDGKAAQALGQKADGNVGCVGVSSLSSLFATPDQISLLTDAKPDSLVGPVPVAGGSYMLFHVRSTKIQPLSQVRSAIEQVIGQPGAQKAQNALSKYMKTADIDLNPRYGSWKKGVGYVAPKGAEHPSTSTTMPLGLTKSGNGGGSGAG